MPGDAARGDEFVLLPARWRGQPREVPRPRAQACKLKPDTWTAVPGSLPIAPSPWLACRRNHRVLAAYRMRRSLSQRGEVE